MAATIDTATIEVGGTANASATLVTLMPPAVVVVRRIGVARGVAVTTTTVTAIETGRETERGITDGEMTEGIRVNVTGDMVPLLSPQRQK